MRTPAPAIAIALPVALFALLLLTPLSTQASILHARDDGHMHMHHGQPKTELTESDMHRTSPSYWSIDNDRDSNTPRYPAFIVLHVVFMSLAFFVALPAGIALRSAKHSYHAVAMVSFWVLCALGCTTSSLYRKLTPDMYEGSAHSLLGYLVLLLSIALSAVDIVALASRLYAFFTSGSNLTLRQFWHTVVWGDHDAMSPSSLEYAGLTSEDIEEYDDIKAVSSHRRRHSALSEHAVFDADFPESSRQSDDTLRDITMTHVLPPNKQPLLRRIARSVYATFERVLVFAAFTMILSGIVTYTGSCKGGYLNICLAHLIKGGIFWCYGLFTFARFLGSHAELGWAWNVSPTGNTISAEFVESTVIFLYGISNTWMERFGAKAGDPYTTRQVQHISIAVMFWFAGLLGMAIESRRVRRWLAASATAAIGPARLHTVPEPASYRASFNPFPALVIGVTGAAMSAHEQPYVFQVQIHELWGWLLLAFSVLRCLTYFFLWLGPPKSALPSRPPTEALGSFFLACGGLMFMLSSEEVTLAAMRNGRDDMMMFLNVAVAMTCFAFCWVLSVVTFNGWLKSRRVLA